MARTTKDAMSSAFSRLHVAMYRRSKGKLGGRMAGQKIVMLTTTGRKSGEDRTKPLVALDYEGQLYVGASYGGSPTHPDWFLNLRDNPTITVEVDGSSHSATAEILDEPERSQVWTVFAQKVKATDKAQQKTDRVFPIVRLRLLA